MLLTPTHRDDIGAYDRAMTIWQQRGPKWQSFGARGRPLAAFRHPDGRVKVLSASEDIDPQEPGDGWRLVSVIEPLAE